MPLAGLLCAAMSERLQAPQTAYSQEEVGQILKRAAGLQREVSAGGATLTQSEIEQIAADAGIDPAQVRRAIGELRQPQQAPLVKAIVGTPTRLSIERTIPGELDPKQHEALALAIRRQLAYSVSGPGMPSTVGRTFHYAVGNRNAPMEISVTPSGGNTVVRIEVNNSSVAGGIFGGILSSVGANAAWILPVHLFTSVPVGIAAALGVIGGTWLGCRLLYSAIVGAQQRRLTRLADALSHQVQATISS